MPKLTPMLTNFSDAKPKFTTWPQIKLPIEFDYPDEQDFFETIKSWALLFDYAIIEEGDHYIGFAAQVGLLGGKALLASWKNGRASIYWFLCDHYHNMIIGAYPKYQTIQKIFLKKPDKRYEVVNLLFTLNVPISKTNIIL